MSDIVFDFFMSQIRPIHDIKENDKTKISMVFYEEIQAPCILKVCKNRDLSNVYQVLVKTTHHNLVTAYDYVYANNNTYVLEELVVGKTLQEIMREKGFFSEKETIRVVMAVCDGLEVLHSHKPPVVHNDINTSNIMIRDDGSVKLIDFDISRTYKEGAEKNTKLLGTEDYASPEHYGFGQSEPRTDIYSLGVTMHEMLTGKGLDINHKVTYKGMLARNIKKCIEVDREKRYATVKQLKKGLKSKKKVALLWGGLLFIFVCFMVFFLFTKEISTDMMVTEETTANRNVSNIDSQQISALKKENNSDEAYLGEKSEETGVSTVLEPKEVIDDTSTPLELKMITSEKLTGEIESMVALEENFVFLQRYRDNNAYTYEIVTSTGIEMVLDDVNGWYGAKLVLDMYTKTLYLLEFGGEEIKVYEVTKGFVLTKVATFDYPYTSNGNCDPCVFFSDGRMVCNVINSMIDTNTWTKVGSVPFAYVINDKLYEMSPKWGFREIDSSGAIITEYKFANSKVTSNHTEQVYVDGKYAYFIGQEENKEYVFRFNGEEYEKIICLNDYAYYTPFSYDFLCVTDDAVRCYDTKLCVMKEFPRK